MTRLTWIVLALAVSNAYAGIASSERTGKSVTLDDDEVSKKSEPAPPPTTKKTTNETEINCMERENGKYTIGCSSWFVMCHNHITHKYDCPARLKFNPMMGHCDYESAIKQCSKKELYKGQIIKTPADFTCANRTDGKLYAHPEIPCSNYYYSCNHGHAGRMPCPAPQYFNEKTQRCDYQARVPACMNRKINGVILAPANVPYGSVAQQEPLGPAPPAPPNPEITNATQVAVSGTDARPNCETNGDGVFPDRQENCANFFFKCANNKLFKYQCQKGLFYDSEAMRCDHKEFIPNCGGVRQVTTPSPVYDASSVDFDCTGKEDGFYVKKDCSSVAYNCNGNVAKEMPCPSDLKFDQKRNMCVYELECGKEDPTTAAPAVTIPGNSIQEDEAKTTEAPIDFDCSNKKDGEYEIAKCQNVYVQCADGKPLRASCPAKLVYSSINRRCDYEDDCKKAAESTTPAAVEPEVSQETKTPYDLKTDATPAATAAVQEVSVYSISSEAQTTTTTTTTTTTAAPTTTAATTTTPATILYGSAQVTENAAAPPVGEVNCANLKNGAYAVAPCSQEYMSCWDGTGHKLPCGSDLYFNPYKSQCDFKINIIDCNPDAPIPQATTAPAADVVIVITTTGAPAPVDNFCQGKKTGFYGNGCSEHFYSCHDGYGSKFSCSNGLFYDADKNQCNHKEMIVACGATVPPTTTTTIAPATVVTTTEVPHIVPSIPVDDFCRDKDTGFYGSACSKSFYSCASGVTYKMMCPEGTFYDVVSKSCLRKEEVAACSAPTTTTPAPASPAEAAPIPGYAFTMAEEPVFVGVFCHDKEDGFHGDGCNAFFYSCHAGTTHKMPCPPGTFYDVDNHKCISKDKIVACGGAPAAAPTAAVAEVAGNTPATPAESFCEKLGDGYYGHGCNNFYFHCSNGVTRELFCPSALFYNKKDHRCDQKENVEACGAKPTVASAAPLAVTTPPSLIVEPFCERLADGIYGHGCNNFYYYCSNAATSKMLCPPGLFYDNKNNRCDHKETVEACGAKPTPANVAPETPATLPAKNPYDIPTQAPVVQRKPVSFNCAGRKDGLYNLNECTPIFIQCYNGQAIQNACQEGLFYNVDNGMCDYAENTAVCKSSLPTSVSTTPVPPTTAASPVERPQLSANATCNGKADGYYSNGCSDVYYVCSSGNLTPLRCGHSTRFDASRTMCDFPQNVPECGGSPATVAPSTPAAPAAPEGAAAQQPKYEFSCDSKTDGFYAIGPCTRYYAHCVSGNPYVRKCPADLHYNKEKGNCDYMENVLGCMKIMATVPAVPITTTTEIPTTVAAPAPPPSLPQRDLPNPCTGKPDGLLAIGDCSPEYLSCAAGAVYSYRCQDGLFFNQALQACDYSIRMPGCQKNAIPAPSLPAAAPAPPPAPQFSIHPAAPMMNGPYGGFPQQQQQQQPMGFNCLGKDDGFYGTPCDNKYWQCRAQMMYTYTCTSGLVYNGQKGACDYPSRTQC